MNFIDFRDTCTITRGGTKDEWDNPIGANVVYEGPCLYEAGGTGYSRSLITLNPTVFLPSVDVQVLINDSITVVTEFDRTIESVVENVRDVNMPWRSNVQVTRIELKQAHGD